MHDGAGLSENQCEDEEYAEPQGMSAPEQEPGLCHTAQYSPDGRVTGGTCVRSRPVARESTAFLQ